MQHAGRLAPASGLHPWGSTTSGTLCTISLFIQRCSFLSLGTTHMSFTTLTDRRPAMTPSTPKRTRYAQRGQASVCTVAGKTRSYRLPPMAVGAGLARDVSCTAQD